MIREEVLRQHFRHLGVDTLQGGSVHVGYGGDIGSLNLYISPGGEEKYTKVHLSIKQAEEVLRRLKVSIKQANRELNGDWSKG